MEKLDLLRDFVNTPFPAFAPKSLLCSAENKNFIPQSSMGVTMEKDT